MKLLAAVVLCSLAAPGIAVAQDQPAAAETPDVLRRDQAAEALFQQAAELQHNGRFAEALPIAERARETWTRSLGPHHHDTLSAITMIGELQHALGRRAEAEALLRRAIDDSLRAQGHNGPSTLHMFRVLARHYREEGRIADARALLRRAIGEGETRLPRNQREHIVNDLRALDRSERRSGTDQNYQYYLTTMEGCERLPMGSPFECARNMANFNRDGGHYVIAEAILRNLVEESERVIGFAEPETLIPAMDLTDFLLSQGRYAEAEPLAYRVAEAVETTFGRDSDGNILAIANLAALHYYQGREAEAEPLLRRVIDDQRRILGYVDPLRLGNLGILYVAQGRYEEAEPLLREAVAGEERSVGLANPNSLDERYRLYNLFALQGQLALVYERLGRGREAEALYRTTLAASEQRLGANDPRTLDLASDLGDSLAGQGRFEEAIPLLRRALAGAETILRPQHPATLSSATNLLTAWEESGATDPERMPIAMRFLIALYEKRTTAGPGLSGSLQRVREAVTDAQRFALFADVGWRAVAANPALRAQLLPPVFGALQASIAGPADRSIAEQAARGYASRRGAALGELIAERQRLKDEWVQLNEDLTYAFADSQSDPERSPAALRTRLEAVQARVDAIDARLRVEAPDYFALIEPRATEIAAARNLVGPDEAILLVVPSRFGTHVMVVTRDADVRWHRSEWTAERVAEAVRRLRWDAGARISGDEAQLTALRGERPEGTPPRFDRETAHALYRELIGPALPSLAGKTRLFIAAGGPLAGLPFSLLVSAEPAGSDDDPAALRATRWFADDFQLTHIPSIQSLAILRGEQAAAPATSARAFIGVGNPALGPTLQARGYRTTRGAGASASQIFMRGRTRNGVPADLTQLRTMPSLPGTAAELQMVRTSLNAPASSVYTGARADERTVRGINYRNARLVLFSTHGLTSEEASGVGEPGLVLTPPPMPDSGNENYLDIDPANDGYLAASEVTTLSMNADWVVLSACNTATGDDNANLSALARAFFYAGARNLLASHWPVSDEVAPLLITRTVAPVATGLTRGAALQQAMRSIRDDPAHPEWAHPFFWAPFVLIGDGGR